MRKLWSALNRFCESEVGWWMAGITLLVLAVYAINPFLIIWVLLILIQRVVRWHDPKFTYWAFFKRVIRC